MCLQCLICSYKYLERYCTQVKVQFEVDLYNKDYGCYSGQFEDWKPIIMSSKVATLRISIGRAIQELDIEWFCQLFVAGE